MSTVDSVNQKIMSLWENWEKEHLSNGRAVTLSSPSREDWPFEGRPGVHAGPSFRRRPHVGWVKLDYAYSTSPPVLVNR